MGKGNLWQYWTPETNLRWTIVAGGDTVMQNGKTYSKIDLQYLRQEGNLVFVYSSPSERVIYDFSKKAGDTIQTQGYPLIKVMNFDTMSIFGYTRKYWSFLNSVYWSRTIVDSIGVTSFIEFPGSIWGLSGAIVNGKTYGTITSVKESNPSFDVNNYSLTQNYPNPFNPATTLNYSIPFTSFVSLKIFNSIGQEIAELVKEEKPTGKYSINWDGSSHPSGLYFYRLQAGNYSETKKMILTK